MRFQNLQSIGGLLLSIAATIACALAIPNAVHAATPMVVSGGGHTCALSNGGGVKCWGMNISGQLGNASKIDSSVPVDVVGLTSGVVALAAGYSHTCALTVYGGVKCWGSNLLGALGDGTNVDSVVPVNVSGLTDGVVAVTIGRQASHTCALTASGGVKCWGENSNGQLGNSSTAKSSVPVNVSGLANGIVATTAGAAHTCAVDANGGILCWGAAVGNGSTILSSVPIYVSGLTSGMVAVAAGMEHTCALSSSGGVKCWGVNTSGQLGNGGNINSSVPVDVSGFASGVSTIDAGGNHTCALTIGRGMKCWGLNFYGELGNGRAADSPIPANVSGLFSGIASISPGGYHTCASTYSGSVKCWGLNSHGQLGDGSTTDKSTPVNVNGLNLNTIKPFGITLIAHGAEPALAGAQGYLPNWVASMANAMDVRMGGSVPIVRLTVTKSLTGQLNVVSSRPLNIDSSNAAAILLIDWSTLASPSCMNLSTQMYTSTSDVANAVFQFLKSDMPSTLKLHWHMIGHSRGASMVTALSTAFSTIGRWTNHLTLLDSHPVSSCHDFPMNLPDSALLADSYYEDYWDTFPQGNSVAGTAETYLNGVLPQSVSGLTTAHSLVHTYYHGTIDQLATNDGDGNAINDYWYSGTFRRTGGFGYSNNTYQTNMAPRTGFPAQAASPLLLQPSGARYQFSASDLSYWNLPAVDTQVMNNNSAVVQREFVPNVRLSNIPTATSYVVGIQRMLRVDSQHRTGSYSLTLELDDDLNPFNANTSACNALIFSGRIAATDNAMQTTLVPWTPSALNIGSCYIKATVADLAGHVQYTYSSQPVRIEAAPAVATPPNAPTIGTATGGEGSVSVSFTPNAIGSGTLVNYTAVCSSDNFGVDWVYGSNTVSPISVYPLTAGVSYVCAVKAISSVAEGPWSFGSNSAVPIGLPDLVVTNVTAGASAVAGGSILVSATVKNQGNASAGAFNLQFVLSTNSTITTSAASTGYSCNPTSLAPGATYTCSGSIVIPASTAGGIYYLGAYVDWNSQVIESTKNNNGRAALDVTTVSSQSPLSISSVALSPATATVGAAFATQQSLTASGGQKPYSWSAVGLPGGLSINSLSSAITGIPAVAGTFGVTVTVTDSSSPAKTATQVMALTVGAALTPIVQTIDFVNPGGQFLGATFPLTATGGSSGNPVTFIALTPAVCTVNVSGGGTYNALPVAIGNCVIQAMQAGSAIYAAATPVTQSFAILIASPVVLLSPTSLNFVGQNVGTMSSPQVVTLTNTGNATLNIIGATPTLGEFSVSHNCGTSLGAGLSCSLTVTYIPTTAGTRLGAVRLTSSAADSPHNVVISGSGLASNIPMCTLTAVPSTIRRGGSSTLTTVCNPAATSFGWTGGTCAGTFASTCVVAPGATTTYGVIGTNASSSSIPISATVTIKQVDLTPILMLLLD